MITKDDAWAALNTAQSGRQRRQRNRDEQASEEAIIKAMVTAEAMTGIENRIVRALPHDRVLEIMKKYGR